MRFTDCSLVRVSELVKHFLQLFFQPIFLQSTVPASRIFFILPAIHALRVAESATGWHRLAAIVAESNRWQLGLSAPDSGDVVLMYYLF
jgi:hypothetical protein